MARVTIMMPCFDAAATLPWALASVRAQTMADWECVCVDDGSSDATWSVLERAAVVDARFRIERFERNRGRGAARQRCLELGSGEYLAFLDSDDWLYPDKLERQLRYFDLFPDLAVVSPGAAVTDEHNAIVGVVRRGLGEGESVVVKRFDRPHPPQMVFPASMVRMESARAAGFDPAMRRSQDSDFLIRVALGERYAVTDELVYAYSQAVAASLAKTLEGYSYRVRSHLKHFGEDPLAVSRTVAATGSKMVAYRLAGAVGLDGALIARRWRAASSSDAAGFARAKALVTEQLSRDATWLT